MIIDEEIRFGLDIGGTKTEFTVINGENEILFRERINNKNTFKENLENVFNLIDLSINRLNIKKIKKIGMSLKGVMDPIKNMISVKCLDWLDNDFLSEIKKKYSCEIFVQNDANCFALAESTIGGGKGYKTGFFLIVGTGCGGGIVFNNQIIDGLNNFSGEWGRTHFVARKKQIDIFENYGKHLNKILTTEDVLSGPAFLDIYNFLNSKNLSNPNEIMELYRNDDKNAKEYFDFYLDNLAFSLHGLINMVTPEVIVFGGGLSNIEELTKELPKYLKKYLHKSLDNIVIKKHVLGDSAGSIGACLL